MALNVGIDLGARAVKVIAGRKKGPVFEIHHALSIPVDLDADDGEEAILAAVSQIGHYLPKAPKARFGLSGRELIIRYVQVPPVPIWRLRLLMDLEVRSMSEKAQETLTHDYNIVSGGPDATEETVMLAVVKEHFLKARHEAIASSCGEPLAGMPASLAVFNSYLHAGELHEGEYVFLVDVGDCNVEVVLQKDGEILFARNVATGGRVLTEAVADTFDVPITQAEGIKHEFGNVTPKGQISYASGKEEKVANALIGPAGQLSSLLQSSLAFARSQTGIRDLRLGRILMSGGGANLKGLDRYLSSSFGCPVERFLPESGLDLSPLDAEEAADFEADPGRFAVALGLALSSANDNAFVMGLAPESVKKKRTLVERTLFLGLTAAAAILFLVFHALELRGEAKKLKEDERRESSLASRARRSREAFDREQQRVRDLNARMIALDAETHVGVALLEAQGLAQRESTDGIWIEEMRVARDIVTVESEEGKRKESRVEVNLEGVIAANDRQPTDRLREWTDAMGARDANKEVVQTSEATSSRALKFKVSVREKKPTPTPVEEGN